MVSHASMLYSDPRGFSHHVEGGLGADSTEKDEKVVMEHD